MPHVDDSEEPTSEELLHEVAEENVRTVVTGNLSFTGHSLREFIEYDRYKQQIEASNNTALGGITFTKLIPPGAGGSP